MASSTKGTFGFRLKVDDAQQFVSDLREAAKSSTEAQRAFDKLIQLSPQLASVNDGVQRKMRETAEGMKNTQAAGTSLAGVMSRAGVLGFAIGAGTEAFGTLVAKIKETYEAIPKAGDATKQMVARLENVTGSAAAAIDAYSKLAAVSRATGAPLADTVDTFQRFSLAAKDLGATSDQVIRVVEGVQKLGVISGAGPQALGAAAQQLGQALASGRLQGDELRSIMENMPELAQGLARELNVSMGALRQMGSDGKLQSEVIWPALQRLVDDVDKKFQAMPPSIERGMNAASAASTQLLGHLDKLLGMSDSIARKWQAIANLMDRARVAFGGGSYAEATADRVAQIAAIDEKIARIGGGNENERELLDMYKRQGLTEQQAMELAMPRMPGDAGPSRAQQVAKLREDRAKLKREQDQADADERARIGAAGEGAYLQGFQGAQARAAERLKEIEEKDKAATAKKKRDEALADLDANFRLGNITEDRFKHLSKIVNDEYTKAIQGATEAVKQHGETWDEYQKRLAKIEDDAQKVALSLDPVAAAYEKVTQQIDALIQASELWEKTAGARGMDPEKAAPLIAKLQTDFIDNIDKIRAGTEKADNTFQQFFANQISGLESAIARGGQYRDVIKGLQQDISVMLTRTFITGPLMKAGSDFMDKQGGLSGLAKSGFEWLTSLFADGGIMTPRGPLQLHSYAGGGIADRPQLALFGEGRMNEAYVPLPDGKRIPVDLRGAGGGGTNITVNVNSSNASPQLIATAVSLAVQESERKIYGDADRGGAAAKKLGRRR